MAAQGRIKWSGKVTWPYSHVSKLSSLLVDEIMTTSALAAAAATVLFAFAMTHAGLTDLTTNKIRNSLVLLLLLGYGVLAPLAGFTAYEIGWSIGVALAVLLFAFILFAMGWIGGGDAKLVAVTALWFGANNTLGYLLCMALLGGVFALTIQLFRMQPLPERLLSKPWIAQLHASGAKMPYGVAMALAALIMFPSTSWITAIF
jgi:prepilin peptidase CpaA